MIGDQPIERIGPVARQQPAGRPIEQLPGAWRAASLADIDHQRQRQHFQFAGPPAAIGRHQRQIGHDRDRIVAARHQPPAGPDQRQPRRRGLFQHQDANFVH